MFKPYLTISTISFLVFLLALTSCKKAGQKEQPSPVTTTTTTDTSTHIYLVGGIGTPTAFSAGFWKDGALKNISPNTQKNSSANCIAIHDTDVYIGGSSSGDIATYWKNGTPVYLNNGQLNGAGISAIGFNGADMYAVGSQINATLSNNYTASYWKNNTYVSLTDANTYSNATGICFSGSDVYISGAYWDSNNNGHPAYWKNGNLQSLDIDAGYDVSTTGIAVVGNDVYVCGYITPPNGKAIATYWKNGSEIKLTDGSSIAEIYCIAVSGTDVYMGGGTVNSNNSGVATYWKNGTPTYLNDGNSNINAVYINKNDIYFAGFTNADNLGDFTPCYWKNGVIHKVAATTSEAIIEGIFVTGGQ